MRASTLIARDRDAGMRRAQCSPGRLAREPLPDAGSGVAEAARTLDDLMAEAWAGLRTGSSIACPVCESAMEPRWSAGAGVVGGRCRGCGSEVA